MSWKQEARELLKVIEPKGRGDIATELVPLFNIYNEHRQEITGSQEAPREISHFCSACIQRVISRLKQYLDANPE